jgi:hypothetical protein
MTFRFKTYFERLIEVCGCLDDGDLLRLDLKPWCNVV